MPKKKKFLKANIPAALGLMDMVHASVWQLEQNAAGNALIVKPLELQAIRLVLEAAMAYIDPNIGPKNKV